METSMNLIGESLDDLMSAVYRNDVDDASQSIHKNPSYMIQPLTSNGDTVLHHALKCRSIQMIKMILQAGQTHGICFLYLWNRKGQSPLHVAAMYPIRDVAQFQFKEILQTLPTDPYHAFMMYDLDIQTHHFDHVNAMDSHDMTPLHYAASCDNEKGVIALLDIGANIFSRNENDDMPTDLAPFGSLAFLRMYFFNDKHPRENTDDTSTPPSRALDWHGTPHGYTDQHKAEKVAYYGSSSFMQ
jgi:ankyrin repeat protein